jgi:myo-inositol catabolism protein IolC
MVERVEIWGGVDEQSDKLCGRYRTCLALGDATTLLHEFACDVAKDALQTAKVGDKRSWAAIAAKRAWLKGEITDDELAAARAAARDAARYAAWYAAWAAARAAARDAARYAARDAARYAARDKYNGWLTERVSKLLEVTNG